MPSAASLLIASLIVLYLFHLFWYGGWGKPLTQAEVESMLTEMKRRARNESQSDESPN